MRLLEYLQEQFGGGAGRPAPILADPANRQTGQDFRLPDDPPHVIRIHEDSLEYVACKLFDKITVEEYSDPRITVAADLFVDGSKREIQLRRYLKNSADPYATDVIGLWEDRSRVLHRKRIGWLPPRVAKEIAERHKGVQLTARVHTLYRPYESAGSLIRIEIWKIGQGALSAGA